MRPIAQLRREISSGSLSAASLVQESLNGLQTAAPLNACISLLHERAQVRAAELDTRRAQGLDNGPLDGIPVAIKDNLCLQQTRTTCASRILENFVAPYTATAVRKLEEAGAIVVAKTNMDEFAMGATNETSFFGPVVNPQDPDLVPGGSSGGSAAVVAARAVPASLGSDTGGSIRQPAACCGVVGLKPTYGRVSRYGLIAYASSLDQIGPLGLTVEDTALVLQAISGADPHDNTTHPGAVDDYVSALHHGVKGLRIGIPQEYFAEGLDDHCREVLESALDKLKAEGAVLVPVSLPAVRYAIASYYLIATAEASSNLSRFDGVRYTHRSPEARTLHDLYCKSRSEGFGREVQTRILLGTYALSSGFYDAYYVQAQKVRRVITDDFTRAFQSCDLLAAPTLPGQPLKRGAALSDPMALYLSDIYTVSLNLAGLPGISVPCADGHGLPVGMQLIGQPFGERRLLQAAAAVERLSGRGV